MNHARILLKADINQEGGGWTDRQISESLDIGHGTIERVRKRYVIPRIKQRNIAKTTLYSRYYVEIYDKLFRLQIPVL